MFGGTVCKRIVIFGDQYVSETKYLTAVANIETQKFYDSTLIKKIGRPIRDPIMHIFEAASLLFYSNLSAKTPPPIELVSPPKNKLAANNIPNSFLNPGKLCK